MSAPVATSIIDGAQVAQMIIAVGGVGAALRWGLPWAIRRFNRRPAASAGASLTVSGSASLGAAMVHVVEIEGRRMVIGSTAQSVCLLAELGAEPAQAEPADAFFDHLDLAMAAPGPAPQAAAAEPEAPIIVSRYAVAPMAPEPAPAKPASAAPRSSDPDEAALEALRRLDQLFGPDESR